MTRLHASALVALAWALVASVACEWYRRRQRRKYGRVMDCGR